MNEMNGVVLRAAQTATNAHSTQLDKAGMPYINHPTRVAQLVRESGGDWAQECAAWLHDVLEDAEIGTTFLAALFPSAVTELVEALTKREGETRDQYYDRLVKTPRAILVKLCDIYDNLDPRRMCYLPSEDQQRLRGKYGRALSYLSSHAAADSHRPRPDPESPPPESSADRSR